MSAPYLPLIQLYADDEMASFLSHDAHVAAWLEVERALAWAQCEAGLVPHAVATAIDAAARPHRLDLDLLDRRTRIVGYPILPLIEQVVDGAPPEVGRHLHWGATTQDIMDTGDALRFARAITLLIERVVTIGDEIGRLARVHASTMLAGRTHGQQAVPTTLGAKLAVWLDEYGRHLERLGSIKRRTATIQLFGAGGTGAALGSTGPEVRRALALRLGLSNRDIPTHTARDELAELGFVLAAVACTCGKVAREVANLARTEIGELREHGGQLRGASSTMPQKANPIDSEGIIGLALVAGQQVPVLLQSMQAVHERAMGEWQAEWDVVPLLFGLSAAALNTTAGLLAGLEVATSQMRENLEADGGLIMAEAVMMAVAPSVGRQRAHELLYEAATAARARKVPLAVTVREVLSADDVEPGKLERALDPANYLGESDRIVGSALSAWTQLRAASVGSRPEAAERMAGRS